MHRAALAGLVLVMACKDKPPTEPAPREGSAAVGLDAATSRPTAASARVALLDSGAEPRAVLRYTLDVGDKQTVVLRIRYRAESRLQAASPMTLVFPTFKFVFHVEIVEALVGDRARYRFELGEAALADVAGADPNIMRMATDALDAARGIRGSAIVDSRGIVADGTMEMPEKLDPSVRVLLESVRTSMEQLSTPLPVDPVGAGARWEVSQTLRQAGTTLDHLIRYELTSDDPEKRELVGTIEQVAGRQDVAVPNIEVAELLSLTATGNATVELNLQRLAPPRALFHIESDSRFEVTTGSRRKGLISKGISDVAVSAQ